MSEEIIQIKCPFDGAVLSVKNQPGIEGKNVTCPICKHNYPFTSFKRVGEWGLKNNSIIEDSSEAELTNYAYKSHSNEETSLNYGNNAIGKLQILGGEGTFQLNPGRNIIGRRSHKSTSHFQINTGESRSMSREHIIIDVKKIPGKGFVHYISLFKEKVNPTYIGQEILSFGDCIHLANGDLIKLPDAILKFELPDDEATDI